MIPVFNRRIEFFLSVFNFKVTKFEHFIIKAYYALSRLSYISLSCIYLSCISS